MKIHTFHFNGNASGERVSLTNHDLLQYAKQIRLNDVAEGRFSWLFTLDVMMMERVYGIDTGPIIEEIKALEEGESGFLTKPPSEFTKNPLKGLWHKHYFSPRFMPHNIMAELPKRKMHKIAEEVFDFKKSEIVTSEMIWEFSQRVTIEAFEKRAEEVRATGEWIVFAKYNRQNHYLCMSTHNAGDAKIAQKIRDICCPQFPFLCEHYPAIAQQAAPADVGANAPPPAEL